MPRGGLGAEEVRFVGAQLAVAIATLHGLRVLHRDVKPHNVVIARNGYVALTDFGLAADLDGDAALIRGKTGTRGYWAPEVVNKEQQHEAADWWSLGVLCHAMFSSNMDGWQGPELMRGGTIHERKATHILMCIAVECDTW